MQASSTSKSTPAALILAGGALATVSAVLGWHDFTAPGRSDTLKGTDLTSGLGTVLFGVVLIVIGAVMFGRKGSGGRGGPITAIVMSAIVLLVGGYSALAPEKAITSFEANDVADDLDISEAEATAALEEGFESGQLEATALVGAWVAAVGGLLGLVGGIMGVAAGGRKKDEYATGPPTTGTPPPGGVAPPVGPAGTAPGSGTMPPAGAAPPAGTAPPPTGTPPDAGGTPPPSG
jgi:hypothetical protein